jgi:hypothetical protein
MYAVLLDSMNTPHLNWAIYTTYPPSGQYIPPIWAIHTPHLGNTYPPSGPYLPHIPFIYHYYRTRASAQNPNPAAACHNDASASSSSKTETLRPLPVRADSRADPNRARTDQSGSGPARPVRSGPTLWAPSGPGPARPGPAGYSKSRSSGSPSPPSSGRRRVSAGSSCRARRGARWIKLCRFKQCQKRGVMCIIHVKCV